MSLIDKALQTSGEQGFVFIGITTGEMISEKKNVKSFEQRKQNILDYIHKKKSTASVEVKPIKDKYGPSIEGEFDAIVVSSETIKTAEEINIRRKNLDKKPLKIIQIPFVLADDGNPISSSRIKNKEINADGELIR
jgi:pantetheine-phosphate adenylyltransferase